MSHEGSNDSSSGASKTIDDYWQYELYVFLEKYGPPFFFIGGMLGNLLSLAVLLKPSMRSKSTFTYLMVLAVADIGFLCVSPLKLTAARLFGYKFHQQGRWLCFTLQFLPAVFQHFSVWILVLVTAERMLVVLNPLKGPLLCRRRWAFTSMGIILLAIIALNLHFYFTQYYDVREMYDFNEETNKTEVTGMRGGCSFLEKHADLRFTWPWIDLCVYSLFPSACMLIMNTIIIWKAWRAHRVRRQMSTVTPTNVTVAPAAEDKHRLIVVLLSLSFTFIISTAPMSAFQIWREIGNVDSNLRDMSLSEQAGVLLAYELCIELMLLNHSLNFLLYCVTGKKFRHELVLLFRHGCRSSATIRRLKYSSTISARGSTRFSTFSHDHRISDSIKREQREMVPMSKELSQKNSSKNGGNDVVTKVVVSKNSPNNPHGGLPDCEPSTVAGTDNSIVLTDYKEKADTN